MRITPRNGVPVVALAVLLAGAVAAVAAPHHRFFVYWDQNEEEDMLLGGQIKVLVPPYDPNGQMCIFPDHSGRFVTGYNPTLPSQHNPGSLLPLMNPPVGEAVWDQHGHFTGQTIYVPGPYALPGSNVGGDIPPDSATGGFASGAYNNNGTFTGCAFDQHGNLFAADLGTAQGQFPSPDNGRIIEWFAPDYTTYCIIIGPTAGGVGPHHVDGTGGLENPGTLAFYHGDLYVPETGRGRVLRFGRRFLPRHAAECGPDGALQPPAPIEVFIQDPNLPFPSGIAHDPTAHGWAVSDVASNVPVFNNRFPAILWYDGHGRPKTDRTPLPAGPYSPFGIAIAPSGDLYFVDIHIVCPGGTLLDCGPQDFGGGVFKVTFTHGSPSTPQAITTGLDFPTSVTVCNPAHQTCPTPP